MSAKIIQFLPKPNPNRQDPMSEGVRQRAIEIFNSGLIPPDTAPSEMNPEDKPA